MRWSIRCNPLVLSMAASQNFHGIDLVELRLVHVGGRAGEHGHAVLQADHLVAELHGQFDVMDIAQAGHVQFLRHLFDQPHDVSAYILYGKLLRRVDENEQAFNAFLKADELDPTLAVVKQQIGNHLAEEGKGKAALSFFLQAVDLGPNVPIYHFSLGQIIYDFRNEFISSGIFTRDTLEREMLKAFGKAAKLAPSNFDYQMRMGEAYYDLASPDWKSALIHWNKLREGATTLLQNEILDLHRARTLGKLGRSNEAKVLLVNVRNMALQRSKTQVISEISQH